MKRIDKNGIEVIKWHLLWSLKDLIYQVYVRILLTTLTINYSENNNYYVWS